MIARLLHDRLPQFAAILAIVLAAAFAIDAWTFYSSHQSLCRGRNVTLSVIADILADAQRSTDSNPLISGAQRRAADRFYRREFSRIMTSRC